MKKLGLTALAGALLLAGTAGAAAQDVHPGIAHLPNIGEAKGDSIHVGFVTFSLEVSDYSQYVYDGLREYLDSLERDYTISLTAAAGHGDHTGLLQLVREAIIGGADVVAVHPTVLELNTTIAELAEQEGVPLIWFNVGPRGMLGEEYPAMSYIGYEHYEGGERVGQFFEHYLADDATIGILRLFPGDYADERLDGAIDWLERTRPDVSFVVEYAEGARDRGYELASSMVTGRPALNAIFAGNSSSAMGAVAAMEALGVDVGVIGYGAITEEVEAILEGRMLGSIMRDPWANGRVIGEVIEKWWDGREDEIEPAYGTFQKLVYSPDLVYEYVSEQYWTGWTEENGRVETECVEDTSSTMVADGFSDPNHIATCDWLERFRN